MWLGWGSNWNTSNEVGCWVTNLTSYWLGSIGSDNIYEVSCANEVKGLGCCCSRQHIWLQIQAVVNLWANSPYNHLNVIWAAAWQNQQSGMCTQRRPRSAWASAQSDQSSLSTRRKLESLAPIEHTAKTLIRLGGCLGWSESLLGAHSLCWFCHVTAQILSTAFLSLQWFKLGSCHLTCERMCKPWSDAAFCSVWSGSTLFASVPKKAH